MAEDSPAKNPTPQLEASLSNLSINSSNAASEDWDRSTSDIQVDSPKTPSTSRVATGHIVDNENECTPGGAKARRTLSDLLRLHAEKGKDLKLSAEDEQRLSEELGKWINSDSSPYEPDDDFFSRPSRDDSSLITASSKVSTEVNGRPRGQSESVLAVNVSSSKPGSPAVEAKT